MDSAVTPIPSGVKVAPERGRLRGEEALERFIAEQPTRVLDLGSGEGEHADRMAAEGIEVIEVDMIQGRDFFLEHYEPFDGIWCCHVLEHQRNPGAFLEKLRHDLKPDGLLAITVPPAKHNIVGGHVTIWNEGLLLYHLILAGFDCREARIGVYGYNISVLVRRNDLRLPRLQHDRGDIETLAPFFPCPMSQGSNGQIGSLNW